MEWYLEVASRHHVEDGGFALRPWQKQVREQVTAVAVTYGPSLVGGASGRLGSGQVLCLGS